VTDVIEGEVRDLEPVRSLVVAQPGQAIVSRPQDGPEQMIATASRLASALKDIVEKKRLYSIISGKKFPQVEAWMTIGRLDNVVAREAERPIRNDDGSYEGFVELVRLSDGMVIGRASALCGTPDDVPWGGGKGGPRSEPARRAMAVTRATSRAFRQQYSWIMALAGYEPTPAEEMPRDDQRPPGQYDTPPDRPKLERTTHESGLVGIAELGKAKGKDGDGNPKAPPSDTQYELRQEATHGHVIGFRLTQGRKGYKVLAFDPLASALSLVNIIGERVTCWGTMHDESFVNDDDRTITYQVMHLERIQTPDGILPAPDDPVAAPMEAESVPLFPKDDDLTGLDF